MLNYPFLLRILFVNYNSNNQIVPKLIVALFSFPVSSFILSLLFDFYWKSEM